MKKVTINQVLLGDKAGALLDEFAKDGFDPEAIVIIGRLGDDLRIRHTCDNSAELLGILTIATQSVAIKD